ncbi:hypothetical protein ACH5RR_004753 [Cinchona calisaya]|uniref:Uncharacterized protein n=1 Tax=Cinchona calisaya TaxID=153742 RepID=A0ABD3AZE2_9GENT
MADNYAKSCLLGFMDHLWFHDVILFTCPSSSTSTLLRSNNLQSSSMSMPVTKELPYSSSNDSQTPLISEDDSSAITTNQVSKQNLSFIITLFLTHSLT